MPVARGGLYMSMRLKRPICPRNEKKDDNKYRQKEAQSKTCCNAKGLLGRSF